MAQFEGSVMTLSWPSFSAAATSALMPPPAAAEVAVDQLAALPLVVLLALVLLELDELHAAVSSRLLTTAALVAIMCLVRTVPSQDTGPGKPGNRQCQILARQVEIMASQHKREVSSP